MRDDGIFSNRYATCGRYVWSSVNGFALPAAPKETAQMISSDLKGLRRVNRGLTCAVTVALAPAAGKPGQA